MFHFGGVYVDMDTLPKPDRVMQLLKTISEPYKVMLSQEQHADDQLYVSTTFMMSVKGHAFWNMVVNNLMNNEAESMWTKTFRYYDVMMRTGSIYLTKQWIKFKHGLLENDDILLLPKEWLRPTSDDLSPFVTVLTGGPTWRDYDADMSELGQTIWKHRDLVLLSVIGSLLLCILFLVLFK